MKIFIYCLLALLASCASVPSSKQNAYSASSLVNNRSGCTVKVFQAGREISPIFSGGVRKFNLAPKPFRIEVAPANCSPTIALVTPSWLEYLLQAPLVYSPAGVFMAGDFEGATVLTNVGGDNPRTSLAEIISLSTTDKTVDRVMKKNFDDLCAGPDSCPTPALAFSSAWPFLDPKTREFRGYAEFDQFSKFESMAAASGKKILAVVYTRLSMSTIRAGSAEGIFYLLEPNALELDFSEQGKAQ